MILESRVMFTDANSVAAGFVYNYYGKRQQVTKYFSEFMQKFPIHVKEAMAILMSIEHAKKHLINKNIVIMCDNIAVVYAIKNHGSYNLCLP